MEDLINKYLPTAISLNDYLVDNPEIGGEEFKASSRIVEILEANQIQVEYPYLGFETSFKATINKGKATKVAILAEYDALRGLGHACGHSASGSISVLSTLILNDIKEQVNAQIDLIGTPDEEVTGTKINLTNLGAFDQYDFAIMIHMHNKNAVYTNFLALDAFTIHFTGKPSHAAATPWEGRNALNASRLFFDAIDMMRQHVKDDVRLHGFITNGGSASNIVPAYTSIEFLARARERNYLNDISSWVKDCSEAAALATRTKAEVVPLGLPFHDLSSKKSGEDVLETIYKSLGLETVDLRSEAAGSSDIGNVDYVCPAFHPLISIEEDFGLHTEEFAQAMKSKKTYNAIRNGSMIITRFIQTVINDPTLLTAIQHEHRNNRGL